MEIGVVSKYQEINKKVIWLKSSPEKHWNRAIFYASFKNMCILWTSREERANLMADYGSIKKRNPQPSGMKNW